jgi:hypothetical protein
MWRSHSDAIACCASGNANARIIALRRRRNLLRFYNVISERHDGMPTFLHTDDYPILEMTIDTPNGIVLLRSRSQGEHHVPWEVRFSGQSYIVTDPAIFAVWEQCLPALRPDALQEVITSVEQQAVEPDK